MAGVHTPRHSHFASDHRRFKYKNGVKKDILVRGNDLFVTVDLSSSRFRAGKRSRGHVFFVVWQREGEKKEPSRHVVGASTSDHVTFVKIQVFVEDIKTYTSVHMERGVIDK